MLIEDNPDQPQRDRETESKREQERARESKREQERARESKREQERARERGLITWVMESADVCQHGPEDRVNGR